MGDRALESLRRSHPPWRRLVADQAPLIASILHLIILPNTRLWPRQERARPTWRAGRRSRSTPCSATWTALKNALFEDHGHGVPGDRVRLEQERILFGWFRQALDAIPVPG